MTWKGKLSELLFPTQCFLCRRVTWGDALCADCRRKWEARVMREYRCEEFTLRGVDRLCYLSYYARNGDPVSDFLRRAKHTCRKKAIAYAASEAKTVLEQYLAYPLYCYTFVWVPRSDRAVRRFGFDQAALLAQALAKACGGTALCALCHLGNRKQKTLGRDDRLSNAMQSYRVRAEAEAFLRERHVILIDDVVTTGATAQACATLLRQAGVKSVDMFCMSRTKRR